REDHVPQTGRNVVNEPNTLNRFHVESPNFFVCCLRHIWLFRFSQWAGAIKKIAASSSAAMDEAPGPVAVAYVCALVLGALFASTLDPGCSNRILMGVLTMTRETFDYVIVGGGSAGCVLANRLSEDRSVTVLLLEAGQNDWSPLFRIPIGTIKIGGEYDWQFQAEPDPSRNGKVDSWAAGKVLGGGSSINAMFWARGNPHDYDSWADSGCTGWSYADVLPYFRKSETFDGGGDAFRGD